MPNLQLKRSVELASVNVNYHPVKPLVLSGRAASKWVKENSNGLRSKYSAQLLGGRVTYDISNRWDIGLVGNALLSGDGKTRQYGLGLEVGYLLASNLWLSAGYNFFGFKDSDLAGTDYTNQGAFLRMRFKFDEDVFAGKDAKTNNTIAPGGE